MSKTEEVLAFMMELRVLLEEERYVLINNQGDRLVEIVKKKEQLLEKLASFNDDEVEVAKLNDLSREIKHLQETNLTLTEQSMDFTQMLLENIQKNAQKNNNYSKKGTYEKSNQATFIDESL
jgi:uncharacterized protein YoxC